MNERWIYHNGNLCAKGLIFTAPVSFEKFHRDDLIDAIYLMEDCFLSFLAHTQDMDKFSSFAEDVTLARF